MTIEEIVSIIGDENREMAGYIKDSMSGISFNDDSDMKLFVEMLFIAISRNIR